MIYIDAHGNSYTSFILDRKHDGFNFQAVGTGIDLRLHNLFRIFPVCRGGDGGGGFQFSEPLQTVGSGISKAERAYRAHGIRINGKTVRADHTRRAVRSFSRGGQ